MKKIGKICLALSVFATLANAGIREAEVRDVKRAIVKQKIPNCVEPKSYYDKVYCAGKVYAVLDDRLNIVYKNLRKKLSSEQKNKLKKVQIFWIRNRDDKCASISKEGINLNLTCASHKTLESIVYLEHMSKNLADFEALLEEYKEGK